MDQETVNQTQKLTPMNKTALVELMNQADVFAEHVKKSSGILVSKNLLQGTPKMGRVYAIADDVVDPEFVIGDIVIFKQQELFQGFKHDDKDLASIPVKDIVGKIIERG